LATGGALVTFMTMTKLQLGLAGALAVAGTTGLALQARSNADLRAELASLRQGNTALTALRTENTQLQRTAVELADLRGDDAELKRLNEEAAGLNARMQRVAQAERARANSAETYDLAKLDRMPAATFRARPEYPAQLRASGIGGTVTVGFIVDAKGDVHGANAVKSSIDKKPTNAVEMEAFTVATEKAPGAAVAAGEVSAETTKLLLEAAAVEAVAKWKFAAGRKGGRDVNTLMQIPIVFSVDAK
jgi:TonB family protein